MQEKDRRKEIEQWKENKKIAEKYGMKSGLTGYLHACYSHNLENMKIWIGGIISNPDDRGERLEKFKMKYGKDERLLIILMKTIALADKQMGRYAMTPNDMDKIFCTAEEAHGSLANQKRSESVVYL